MTLLLKPSKAILERFRFSVLNPILMSINVLNPILMSINVLNPILMSINVLKIGEIVL